MNYRQTKSEISVHKYEFCWCSISVCLKHPIIINYVNIVPLGHKYDYSLDQNHFLLDNISPDILQRYYSFSGLYYRFIFSSTPRNNEDNQ